MKLRIWHVLLLLALALPGAGAGRALGLEAGDKGLMINFGNLGNFTLDYPVITVKGGEEKPLEVKTEGKKKAVIKYQTGTELTVEIDGGKARLSFANFPADFSKFKMAMLISFNLRDGGRWEADGNAGGPFPQEKPEKAQFFSNHTRNLAIIAVDDTRINLGLPPYTYVQLQDNREWGWSVYGMTAFFPFNKDNPVVEISMNTDKSSAKRVILMDKFGQNARKDFPGKIASEEELKADIAAQERYFASFKPHALDEFGGLPGSGEKLGLKKTGFFHTQKINERWVLVNPAGNAFFQLGICGMVPCDDFTYVTGREEVFEWLPPREGEFAGAWHKDKWWSDKAVSFYIANVIRKFGKWDVDENQERNIARVRQLGFNSSGAWAHISDKTKELKWPYCPFLPNPKAMPGIRGIFDPFSAENIAFIEKRYAEVLPARADDPLVIGWFLENEQAFEDLPRGLPKLGEKDAAKVRLIANMEKKYKTIAAFNEAWGIKEESFASAIKNSLPVLTKAAFDDMHEFTGEVIEAYYKLIRENFDKHNKNHMLIGNRWQPGTANSEQLCRIAGKYNDIISVNYYTYGIDKNFVERIYKWSGEKPQLWSEFHYCSGKDSGVPGRVDVGSQEMRGLAYRNYVENAAALGFVLGVQWFILVDQPLTGRFFSKYSGENYNVGLFCVADRPYTAMTDEMAKTNNGAIYDVWFGQARPYALDDPRFSTSSTRKAARQISVPRMEKQKPVNGQLEGWPNIPPENIGSNQLVHGSDTAGTEANFKLSYDDEFLYVFVQVRDETPLNNTATGDGLWAGDCVEIFIGKEEVGEGGALRFSDRQILLGASKEGDEFFYANVEKQPQIKMAVVPATDGKGYVVEAALPWESLDIKPALGMELMFDLGLGDSDGTKRMRQFMWNGTASNSRERGNWGRALLAR